MLYNTCNNFQDFFWYNLENGEYGLNGTLYGSCNNHPDREASIAGIFWDIFDANDSIEDFSTYGISPPPPNCYNPDGIGDSLSNGIGNIRNVLMFRDVDGHHPDNIDDFWEAWFQSDNSLCHGKAMEDIWYEHGEIINCCQLRGDLAIPKDSNLLINDIVWLVNYLFKGGDYPCCEEEADINDDDLVNVADPTYFVNALFKGGPPVPTCP